MELEYIHEGSSDCPLIRLFNFQTTEINNLHLMVSGLAEGKRDSIVLNELAFVDSIEGCSLTLILGGTDNGIF